MSSIAVKLHQLCWSYIDCGEVTSITLKLHQLRWSYISRYWSAQSDYPAVTLMTYLSLCCCSRWDLRMNNEEAVEDLSLEGHTDLITGLAISPDGNHLLSNGFVNNIAISLSNYILRSVAFMSITPTTFNSHSTSSGTGWTRAFTSGMWSPSELEGSVPQDGKGVLLVRSTVQRNCF